MPVFLPLFTVIGRMSES